MKHWIVVVYMPGQTGKTFAEKCRAGNRTEYGRGEIEANTRLEAIAKYKRLHRFPGQCANFAGRLMTAWRAK